MRSLLTFVIVASSCFMHVEMAFSQYGFINTIAGIDTAGFSGDGGLAINAKLKAPESIYFDKTGNIYIADAGNNRIRKIDALTKNITTIAGKSDTGSFSCDGGLAVNARLFIPEAVFTDTSNNVYIADAANHRIRKIDALTNIISTIAGSGATGIGAGSFSGDGGLATNATLNAPSGLCLDKYGNVYIADWGNFRIRKIDASSGVITTVAGKSTFGYSGDGGLPTNAQLNSPIQVFIDNSDNILIADQGNHAIRKIDATTGIITTIAGIPGTPSYTGDGGPAVNATLDQPAGIFVDKQGNIFIAEYWNAVIRKIDAVTGIITTVAGNHTWGFSGDGGPATNASLHGCSDVFIDNDGNMIIADYENSRIRKVTYNLGTNEMANQNEINIFPNPATDNSTIENAIGCEMKIFNLLGEQVFEKRIANQKQTVNIEQLINGVYVIQLINAEGEKKNLRLIKQ